MNLNKNISVWRGNNTPPSQYHLWQKGDVLLHHNGLEWVENKVPMASPSQNGLMSKEDKDKLDELADEQVVADEEDITSVNGQLKLKDRDNTDGMGYVILRKNKSFAEQVTKENTIYEIRYEFDLNNQEVKIPNNCVLKFTGGLIKNGVLKSTSANIDAGYVKIFSNIKFKDYWAQEFIVEWWGANYLNTNNEVYINEAIQSLDSPYSSSNNEKIGNTLLLYGRYIISDTIFMGNFVTLKGRTEFSRGRYTNPSSCILTNFSDGNKWVIDTKYKDGTIIPYNHLNIDNHDNLVTNKLSSISGIHIQKYGGQDVYGGIRLSGLVCNKIENIDLSCNLNIGLAILSTSWNIMCSNICIYANFCGIYLGYGITTTQFNNCWIVKNIVNYDMSLTPKILDTSIPPYLDKLNSVSVLMEESRASFYGCIFQSFDALIIGSMYDAYIDNPYVEDIKKTIAWIYSNVEYKIDTANKKVVLKNNQLGNIDVSSYAFGSENAIIETYNFMGGTCYTGNYTRYPRYLIHILPAGNNCIQYYDDIHVESGEVVSMTKCPYKKIILEGKDCNNEFADVYVRPSNTYNPNAPYTYYKAMTGFSSTTPTLYSEIIKRGYNNVKIHSLINDTLFTSEVPIENKHFIIERLKDGDGSCHFGESIDILNSTIEFKGSEQGDALLLYTEENINSYFNVLGDSTFILHNGATVYYNNTLSNITLFKLSGTKSMNVVVKWFVTKDLFDARAVTLAIEHLENLNSDYPFTIHVELKNIDTNQINMYDFTNKIRPTLGLVKGYTYFDTTLNKPIYWTGTKWIDATGADV